MKRAALIGLDGMAWHILNDLSNRGVMPNLGGIVRSSLRGTLQSTIPPESGPAWTSIATGVNPGKHGVFSFTTPAENFTDMRIMSSRDVKYLRIHEMVAIQNRVSVCVNQLLTYPIKRIPKSYVITDWLSPEIKCSPEIQQYSEKYRGPTLGRALPQLTKDWNAEYAELSSRVDTVKVLLQKIDWDLFWVVFSEPDHLLHRYYDLVVKRDNRVMRLFTKIDEVFDVAKERADLMIVVSDHGFRKFSKGVYVNTFLERLGFAEKVAQRSLRDISCQRQVGDPRLRLRLPGVLNQYLSVIPSPIDTVLLRVYKLLLKADVKVAMTDHVDPSNSSAFAHGFGVYVREKRAIHYLVSMLRKQSFIGGAWRREEIYSGNQLQAMPDIVVVPNFSRGFAFRSDVIAPKAVVTRDFSDHNPNGIIIVHGKSAQPSVTENLTVYDVAPTLLDFLGLEIPEDADGRVIGPTS